MRKKLLIITMSLALCLTLWPAAAFAEDVQTSVNVPGKGLAIPVQGGNIYFDNGTGTITGCDAGVKAASVPTSVNGVAVTRIGDEAFSGNQNLTDVTLPEGLRTIEKNAFASCTALKGINIPATLETVGSGAFASCRALEGFQVAEENRYFAGREGVLFNKDMDLLIQYPAGKSGSTYRIPEGVTQIGDRSFEETVDLNTLYLPDSMDSLEDRDLKGAASLRKIVFGDNLLVIGDEVFSGCTGLTGVDVPSGVVSIGSGAFKDCTGLQKVSFPSSAAVLGDGLFNGCSALEAVTVAGSNRRYASEEGVLFNKNKTTLLWYPAAIARSYYKIPDTVKDLGENAFSEAKDLKSLILPSGMKTVPENAFSNLDSLTEVTLPQGVERVGAFAFSECDALIQVMITDSTVLIDRSAFADCPKLKDVYFSGSPAQWQSACKWPSGQPYSGIWMHYNTVPGLPMTDIVPGRWSAADITYVYQNGLMKGTALGIFEPLTHTTRGMIVTILHRMENEPAAGSTAGFYDVTSGSYYYNAVRWVASEGIVNGTGAGTFAPENGITREQLAVILYRYAGYKGSAGTPDTSISDYRSRFSDVGSVSGYAGEAMAWALEKGLINGNEGRLDPQVVTSREQVAAILHRFCEQ